jgi:hypothetical protein
MRALACRRKFLEGRIASSEWRIASFSGGQCSRTAENFRRIRRCALQFFPACFSRLCFCSHRLKTGRRTRDEKVGGRNSCRAESYRQIVKSANRQVGKRTAANSDWRMLKQQRVANGFSGGQCSCTAEKFLCLTIAPYTQHSNFGSLGRFALPNAERIRRSEKSVKSHVPCPVPLVPHWLKPVA